MTTLIGRTGQEGGDKRFRTKIIRLPRSLDCRDLVDNTSLRQFPRQTLARKNVLNEAFTKNSQERKIIMRDGIGKHYLISCFCDSSYSKSSRLSIILVGSAVAANICIIL